MMLTIKEAMTFTGMPYYAIRKLCIEGKVRFVRSGTKYYLNKESLKAYLNGEDADCTHSA